MPAVSIGFFLSVSISVTNAAKWLLKFVCYYVSQSSDWSPPTSNWIPPQSDWTPHNIVWSPPANDWIPPPPWSPPVADFDPTPLQTRTPMDQLVEMGFADRHRNQQLLDKYGGDVQRAIQDLVDDVNDWHVMRH